MSSSSMLLRGLWLLRLRCQCKPLAGVLTEEHPHFEAVAVKGEVPEDLALLSRYRTPGSSKCTLGYVPLSLPGLPSIQKSPLISFCLLPQVIS